MRFPFLFSCLEKIIFRNAALRKRPRILCKLLDLFKVSGRRVSRWPQGFLIECDLSVVFERSIYLGLYDLAELSLLDRLLKGEGMFIDCGANLGLYSLYAANKLGWEGSVCSFEPNPEVFSRLRENIRLNGFEKFIEAHEVALSDKEGTAELQIPSYTHTVASLSPLGEEDPGAKTLVVPLDTLDSLVDGRQVEGMKIDAEGHELPILQGAENTLRKHCPWLLLEYSATREEKASLAEWAVHRYLETLRYEAYEITDPSTPLKPNAVRYDLHDAINLLYRRPL